MSPYLRGLSLVLMFASACAAPKGAAKPTAKGELKKAPPAPVKVAARNGQPDPNELICTFEKDTGSMIPHKTCRTRWQIEEDRRQVDDLVTRHSSQSMRGQ